MGSNRAGLDAIPGEAFIAIGRRGVIRAQDVNSIAEHGRSCA